MAYTITNQEAKEIKLSAYKRGFLAGSLIVSFLASIIIIIWQ